jgi:ferric-dicitrate binding protein FerR (iron transport regulator)
MRMNVFRTEGDVAERAARWLEDLKTAGPAERRKFLEWVCQSPEHVRLFLEMSATAEELEQVRLGGMLDVQALLEAAPSNVVSLPEERVAGERSVFGPGLPRPL